ncbi:hypothetical protein GW17_00010923 [Ensete ventricosum]|nr:hypothetical protein GW17_00010923 [Ensete ventricosum]
MATKCRPSQLPFFCVIVIDEEGEKTEETRGQSQTTRTQRYGAPAGAARERGGSTDVLGHVVGSSWARVRATDHRSLARQDQRVPSSQSTWQLRSPMASKGENRGGSPTAEEGEEVERCPVEEVALVVPETDDPSLPVMTFRAWFLGLTSCSLLIFLNTFFTYRTQPLTISGILMQIAVLPAGRFMASVLPNREVKVFRNWGFHLNPGPFNIKEHVIITIFANCGVSIGGGDAYSIGAITVMKAYYKQSLSFLCALIIVLTTQVKENGSFFLFHLCM